MQRFSSWALPAWSVTLGRRATFQFGIERRPYVVLFVAVLFTAAGSAYYHAAPDNEALFFDRLPITIAFMALVASQIVDRIGVERGSRHCCRCSCSAQHPSCTGAQANEPAQAMSPYVVRGVFDRHTAVLASILSRYTCGKYVYWVLAWYVLGKCLETFDAEVLEWSRIVSGHTLEASRGRNRRRRRLPDADAPDAGRHRGRLDHARRPVPRRLRPDGQFDEERTDRPGVHHRPAADRGNAHPLPRSGCGYRATGELRDGVMRAGCEFAGSRQRFRCRRRRGSGARTAVMRPIPAVVNTVIDKSAANTSGVSRLNCAESTRLADPAVAADELADNRADERQRKRDLQRVGDVRRRVPQPHHREHAIARAAGQARQVEDVGLDLAQARQRIDEDRNSASRNASRIFDSKPSPNQMTKSGAIAILGMPLNAARNGDHALHAST